MPLTTLDKLQTLKDAEFHALCDELLPRISPHYHPLVPHGRNDKGDSIVGQPDSYVGDSAETCRIAIQYTVQKQSWWSKVVQDVEDARRASSKAEEIVIVLPRDVDREKPSKGEGQNWLDDAKKAAAPAKLTVFHGRTLAKQLDDACQDLRYIHLDISFSRLSWHALMTSCRDASASTVDRLASLERYDADRYVNREADNRLFQLWQRSLSNASGQSASADRRILVPLVADSGIGKTSLLAHFAARGSTNAPLLLLLARDISFDDSDSLIREVMSRLLGLMDAQTQSQEECHVAQTLAGKTPLTVVLDGLDETANPAGVRKAISQWLWSRLGRNSVLIVSSRPEFWRNCRDASWANLILKDNQHRKAARPLRHEEDLAALDPMQGIVLPGLFTQHDLAEAWSKSGRTDVEAWRLPPEVRDELKHPFTARSALDLLAGGTPLDDLQTRTGILDLWLTSRLRAETDGATRVTESQFRECLVTIARVAEQHAGSFVVVDELKDVPRFDSANPPGPAVERLIAANVLETHPQQHDRIRFTFEAVYDFFLAECALNEIQNDPSIAADHFASMSFTMAVTRLERIGHQIAAQPFREDFIRSLSKVDGPMAAAVLRVSVDAYSPECRQTVVAAVTKLFKSRMIVDRALATELLGRIKCAESAKALVDFWQENPTSKRLLGYIANAAISHGLVQLVPDVFQTPWFARDDYFVDLRPELLATSEEFRRELTNLACRYLPSEKHSDEYRRSLSVLGYLGDRRAVEAIKHRTQNNSPFFYESLCLLVIGSVEAIEVYSSLVDRFLEEKRSGLEHDEEQNKWGAVTGCMSSVGGMTTSHVEDFVITQILSEDPERQLIGRHLAKKLATERLLPMVIKRWRVDGYSFFGGDDELGRQLGSEMWLELWNREPAQEEKQALLQVAADLRDPRIEDILIEHLVDPELAGYCAHSLAGMGSVRACPAIRQLLAQRCELENEKDWPRNSAFYALVRLRDPFAVPEIVRYLESCDGENEYLGTIGLASIGTDEAGRALRDLKNQSDELMVRGLVHFGSRECVEQAVQIAKRHDSGVEWLLENCRFAFHSYHGRRRHEFRTDIDLSPLIDYSRAVELTQSMYEHLRSLVDDVDSPIVRELLREWRELRGTPGDLTMESPKDTKVSSVAFGELAERGDDSVLTQFVKKQIDRHKGYRIHDFIVEDLAVFDRDKIQETMRKLLREYADEKSLIAVIDLIARIGDETDFAALDSLIEHKSDDVANAAYEARLRLSDPLRLANNW